MAELLATLVFALMLIVPAAWVVLELTKYKIHVAERVNAQLAGGEGAAPADFERHERNFYELKVMHFAQGLEGFFRAKYSDDEGSMVWALTVAISVILILINQILRAIFGVIVRLQKQTRLSKASSTFMVMMAFAYVVNLTLVTLVVHTPLLNGAYYSTLGREIYDHWVAPFLEADEAKLATCAENASSGCVKMLWGMSIARMEGILRMVAEQLDDHWYDSGGLIQQMTVLLLTDTYVTPLVAELFTLLKTFLRCHVGRCQYAQARMNEFYEPLEYHLHDRCAARLAARRPFSSTRGAHPVPSPAAQHPSPAPTPAGMRRCSSTRRSRSSSLPPRRCSTSLAGSRSSSRRCCRSSCSSSSTKCRPRSTSRSPSARASAWRSSSGCTW